MKPSVVLLKVKNNTEKRVYKFSWSLLLLQNTDKKNLEREPQTRNHEFHEVEMFPPSRSNPFLHLVIKNVSRYEQTSHRKHLVVLFFTWSRWIAER